MNYKPINGEQGCKCSNCGMAWGQHFQDECPEHAHYWNEVTPDGETYRHVHKGGGIPHGHHGSRYYRPVIRVVEHLSPQEIEALTEKNLTPKLSNVPWLTEEDALRLLDGAGFRCGQFYSLKDMADAVILGYNKGFSTGVNKDCSGCQQKINKVVKVIEDTSMRISGLMSQKEIDARVQSAAKFAGIEVIKN